MLRTEFEWPGLVARLRGVNLRFGECFCFGGLCVAEFCFGVGGRDRLCGDCLLGENRHVVGFHTHEAARDDEGADGRGTFGEGELEFADAELGQNRSPAGEEAHETVGGGDGGVGDRIVDERGGGSHEFAAEGLLGQDRSPSRAGKGPNAGLLGVRGRMVRVRNREFLIGGACREGCILDSLWLMNPESANLVPRAPTMGAVWKWVVLVAVLGVIVASALMFGSTGNGWPGAEVLGIRGFRVIAAAAVGAGLGLAGVLLQVLLRNPLASPDMLGLASGGGLGVAVSVYLAHLAGFGIANSGSITVGAAVGCFVALGLVFALGRRQGLVDPFTLLLVGVVIGIVCSAATQFITHLLPDQGVAAQRMLLGAVRETDLTWAEVIGVGAMVVAGLVFAWSQHFALDCLALGDDEAASIGVSVGRLRMGLVVVAGLVTAGTVVVAGPIGFVGIVAPHAVRMVMGSSHRMLVPASAIVGAALVVGADTLVRVADFGSGRMPISVVTALVGGPTLVYLLRKSRRESVG